MNIPHTYLFTFLLTQRYNISLIYITKCISTCGLTGFKFQYCHHYQYVQCYCFLLALQALSFLYFLEFLKSTDQFTKSSIIKSPCDTWIDVKSHHIICSGITLSPNPHYWEARNPFADSDHSLCCLGYWGAVILLTKYCIFFRRRPYQTTFFFLFQSPTYVIGIMTYCCVDKHERIRILTWKVLQCFVLFWGFFCVSNLS